MDPALEKALCSIRNGHDEIVGAGFLVGPDLVCTCAHVVQLSLGESGERRDPPPEDALLTVRFDSVAVSLQALIGTWGPSVGAGSDIALLKLIEGSPPGVEPIGVVHGEDLSGSQFAVLGYPVGRDDGRYAYGMIRDVLPGGRIQLEATSSIGIRIAGGFSGSPVLLPDAGLAVGVLVAVDADEATRTSFAISSRDLELLGIEVPDVPVLPAAAQKYVGRLRVGLERSYPIPEPNLDISVNLGDAVGEAAGTLIAALDSSPRAALHAPAGAGKSGVVGRLAREVSDRGDLAVVLNLKSWTLDSSRDLQSAGDTKERLDVVLGLSIADLDANGLRALQEGGVVFLVADGLNEVSGSDALRGIMRALDGSLRSHPDTTRALIVDRGRIGAIASLTEDRWSNAELNPLSPADVESIIDERFGAGTYASLTLPSRDLLSSPYFFHQAVNTGQPDLGSRLTALRAFFEQEVHLDEVEVTAIGQVAFHALQSFRSYSFPVAWYESEVDEALRTKLAAGGVLKDGGELLQFNHQLKHDFLVSTWVSTREDLWAPETFDVVTFETQSLELLGLALEQMDSPTAGDSFMAAVYDWSYPAALHCLGKALSAEQEPVSAEMQAFLLAVTTEKRWDPVIRSRERTVKSLQDLGEAAEPYLKCEDPAGLIDVVQGIDSDVDWFVGWKTLFALVSQLVSEPTVQRIQSIDGRVGWTMANVLRRFPLTDAQQAQLRAIFRSHTSIENRQGATVRWRTVHALGKSTGPDNRDLLFEGLDDPDRWVSYGSIRALVEMASTSDGDFRRSILEGVKSRLAALPVRVIDELGSCVFLEEVPADWKEDVLPLLEVVLSTRDSDAEKEQWATLLERFHEYVEVGSP